MKVKFGGNGGYGGGGSAGRFGEAAADYFRRFGTKLILAALGLAVLVLLLSGIYSVGPGEQGVVRTFGRESAKTGPGLHYSIPIVQRVNVVNVENVRRVEVGFRGKERVPNEALMITGDENIVEAQMIIQYRVTDTSKALFRLKDPEDTLRAAAEVALRGKVGQTTIDEVLTTGREKVQDETRTWLQELMNAYQSGLTIMEVKLLVVDAPNEVREAFHDVVRAREEKEKLINQAKGYRADVLPRARGEAEQVMREAEGYKEQRVLRARGDAARFDATLAEYRKAEGVTRERLYLETMERILGKIETKTLVDKSVAQGALPILSLPGAAAVTAGGKQP